MYFEVKVKYDKTLESGQTKSTSERYLFNALSVTEAEARATAELSPFTQGEFEVTDCNQSKYSEVFTNNEGDRYYAAKVNFLTIDEKSGAEKKAPFNYLVSGNNFDDALKNLKTEMNPLISDWEIEKFDETRIIDVFNNSDSDSDDE